MRFLAAIYIFIASLSIPPAMASDVATTCSPVKKPIFYVVESGDHLADIIRTFGFKPLYKKKSRVTQVSQMNGILDSDLIFPGQEIFLPFHCEEDAAIYVLIELEQDRQIDTKHLVKVKTKIHKNGTRQTMMRLPTGTMVAFKEEMLPLPRQNALPLDLRKTASVNDQIPLLAPSVDEMGKAYLANSYLTAGLIYGFHRIESKEIDGSASALLLSRPITGLALGWGQNWAPKFSSSFDFALRQIDMKRASSGDLQDGRQTLSGIGLGLNYQWTEKFKSSLGFYYDERLFVRSIQSGTAVLEVYQQPSVDLKLEHEMARSGALSMDLMLGYRQMLKTSTESATMFESGEYLMGARIRQQLRALQIELKLNYSKGQQKTSLTNQDNSALESQIGIKMEIGP